MATDSATGRRGGIPGRCAAPSPSVTFNFGTDNRVGHAPELNGCAAKHERRASRNNQLRSLLLFYIYGRPLPARARLLFLRAPSEDANYKRCRAEHDRGQSLSPLLDPRNVFFEGSRSANATEAIRPPTLFGQNCSLIRQISHFYDAN